MDIVQKEMSEILKYGWHECSNGQHFFHPYEFNVMKMIGYLIDYADILRNQYGYSTLCAIAPGCVSLDESAQK